MTDIMDRLFERTAIQENGCWQWTGSCFYNKQYGQIKYLGKNWLTHRLAYFLCVNDIPEGLCVLHSCDNPGCINPEHLFLGTHQDNKDDCMAKDRHAYGNKIGNSRLTPDKVQEIRKLLGDGATILDIADQYGIGRTTVWNIRYDRTWRHV